MAQKRRNPDTSGNCHRTKVFAALRDKNIPSIEGVENPICATCHLLEACRFKSGKGFGYRNLRAKVLKCDRIGAHPDSAPDPVDYDWTNCGNFWDEVMQTVQPIHPVTVELPDIDRVMAELMIYCPQEQLSFYFCADYDLSFLEMKVENINAADITIEAASKDEKSWWKIQNAVKELWSQGRNITQAAVESISGITQGYISKVVSKFSGNWKDWLKIFLSLLNTFNSKRNNSDESSDGLRDEAHSIGCNVMPLFADYDNTDLLSEVFSWYRDLDNKYWQCILETTPVQVQGKIIVGLLSMLPKPWYQELMELCYG